MNHRRVAFTAVVLALSLTVGGIAAASEPPVESAEQRDARMAWWRDARFGMFIHWGLYAIPAGVWDGKEVGGIGEWIMHEAHIPVAAYAAYAARFDPVRFDADQWVLMAKKAGMRYIVITAKHHDGFAMYATKASPFNIVDATPFKRDPLRELADACRAHGMPLGFYYSQSQDWHHPGGAAARGHWDPAQDGDYDAYLRTIAEPQVQELLTNYGPGIPAVLWYDTPMDMDRARAERFLPLMAPRPDLIWNNRLGTFAGDTETPEQVIPPTGFAGRDWETCMTINDTWGFKSTDHAWKSTRDLLRNLVDIASKGGNYLLNVGPTAEGVIPAPSIERLAEIGAWMAVNGDAIYGTSASPFARLRWGRATRKPGFLYLHVFDWPADGKLHVPCANVIRSARLLAAPDVPLAVTSGAGGAVVTVGPTAIDPIDTVVELRFDGDVLPSVAMPIAQAADGSIACAPADADLVGTSIKLESEPENIGYWSQDDVATWRMEVATPGTFTVRCTYALAPEAGGNVIAIIAEDQALNATLAATKGWGDYVTVDLGTLVVAKAATSTLTIKAAGATRIGLMNLRALTLVPVAR